MVLSVNPVPASRADLISKWKSPTLRSISIVLFAVLITSCTVHCSLFTVRSSQFLISLKQPVKSMERPLPLSANRILLIQVPKPAPCRRLGRSFLHASHAQNQAQYNSEGAGNG